MSKKKYLKLEMTEETHKRFKAAAAIVGLPMSKTINLLMDELSLAAVDGDYSSIDLEAFMEIINNSIEANSKVESTSNGKEAISRSQKKSEQS